MAMKLALPRVAASIGIGEQFVLPFAGFPIAVKGEYEGVPDAIRPLFIQCVIVRSTRNLLVGMNISPR